MAKKPVQKGLTKLIRTRPVILITTLHPDGTVNAGTFGAYTNLSPTQIGIAVGKASHTLRNLRRTGELAINVLSRKIAWASEVCARNVPEDTSEVELAGLTLEEPEKVRTPLIRECVANLECVVEQEIPLGSHSLVVARCVAGRIEESCEDVDGGLDPVKAQVIFAVRYPEPLYAVLSTPFRVHEPLDPGSRGERKPRKGAQAL